MFSFRHYDDWNEVWQGDKAQGRKGLVFKLKLLLSSALLSVVLFTNKILLLRISYENQSKHFKNSMAKITIMVIPPPVTLQPVSYGMF